MKTTVHRNSSKKVISVLVLALIALIQIQSPQILLNNMDNEEIQEDLLQNTDFLPEDIQIPLSQSYTQSRSGSKDNVDVLIHQAYESSSVENINEVSDTMSVSAPNATDFNVSRSDIVLNNIQISNYTNIVEDTSSSDQEITELHVTSFSTDMNCYLTNVSIWLTKTLGKTGNGTLAVFLYKSTWDDSNSRSKPLYSSQSSLGSLVVEYDDIWFNATFGATSSTYLDNSLTDNNTWFIGFEESSGGSAFNVNWKFASDGVDNSEAYYWVTAEDWTHYTIDFTAKIGLSLNKTNVSPSEINLQINNQNVHNNTGKPSHNSGFWDYTGYGSNGGNSIDFVFSADWYDFSLDVNQTTLNYTKTFSANTTTYSVESGEKAYWETQSNFTLFDHRLDNNTVNFTIPYSWMEFNLTQDATSITHTTHSAATNQVLTVFGSDASDGDWALYCNSTNLITNAQVGLGGVDSSFVYSNDTVSFNATLDTTITGDVNLTVYNPTEFGNEMNYTKLGTPSGLSVDFGNWVIKNNISDYGLYRVQVYWENSTDVGIYDTTLYIAGATNYTIPTVDGEEYVKITEETFNITIFYDDVNEEVPILGASISYNLTLGGGWETDSTQANADNSYNITINSSLYTVGLHEIPIKINILINGWHIQTKWRNFNWWETRNNGR